MLCNMSDLDKGINRYLFFFSLLVGVGLIVTSNATETAARQTLQSQLKEVFDRDWNSAYAHPLDSISDNNDS